MTGFDRSWFFPMLFGVCPNQRDKKSEEPISHPTSASQTLVKFAVRLSQTAPAVNKSFSLFPTGVARSNGKDFSKSEARVNRFLIFFQTFFWVASRPTFTRKERETKNIRTQRQCKGICGKSLISKCPSRSVCGAGTCKINRLMFSAKYGQLSVQNRSMPPDNTRAGQART